MKNWRHYSYCLLKGLAWMLVYSVNCEEWCLKVRHPTSLNGWGRCQLFDFGERASWEACLHLHLRISLSFFAFEEEDCFHHGSNEMNCYCYLLINAFLTRNQPFWILRVSAHLLLLPLLLECTLCFACEDPSQMSDLEIHPDLVALSIFWKVDF